VRVHQLLADQDFDRSRRSQQHPHLGHALVQLALLCNLDCLISFTVSSALSAGSYVYPKPIFTKLRDGMQTDCELIFVAQRTHSRTQANLNTELVDRLAPVTIHHALTAQFRGEGGRDEAQQEVCQTLFPSEGVALSTLLGIAMMTYFKLGISPNHNEENNI
jgi:hypothetical protein